MRIILHVVSEGVAELKSLTLIWLRSDDDESKGYVKRIKGIKFSYRGRLVGITLSFSLLISPTPPVRLLLLLQGMTICQECEGNVNTWCSVGEYLSTRQVSSC